MSTPAFASQPANAREQRIYDFLRPYRGECFGDMKGADETAAANRAIKIERKVLVLAQNIFFLAHNHIANTAPAINPSDLFIVMRGWTGDGVANTGSAIAVLVRFPEGTLGVVKATFEAGTSVVEALVGKVDEMLAESF